MGYKCVNCGKSKENGSIVYFIKTIDSQFPCPVCSEKCAKEKIAKDVKILQEKINSIKSMDLIAENWDE